MVNRIIAGVPNTFQNNLHVYRQILATLSSCLLSMSCGMTFGSTAVMLLQLKDDPNFTYDPAFDSWIASMSPLAMMFGSIISGPTSDIIGRKLGQMLLVIPFTIGWLTIGFSRNNTLMLVGRFIIGICTGSVRAVGMVYVGEISDPKNRPVTLFCPTFAIYVGVLFSHILGHYLNWRVASFIFIIPNLICLIIQLFLKESPLWLLGKGRTKEGIESFKWFRGESEEAKIELNLILEYLKEQPKSSLKAIANVILSKAFAKSLMNIMFLFLAVQFCGINTISFYAQDIFKTTFAGEVDAFMLMIVSDVIRGFTTGMMCMFARKLPRRVCFLTGCYGTVFILICLVVYLCINPVGFVWVSLTCLVVYLGIASVMTSVSWSFVAEFFPSNIRGLSSGVSSLISFGLLFISVKITPGLRENFGDAVLYGVFAIGTLISAVALTITLPETNGKSLQNIENSLYNKEKDVVLQEGQSDNKPC